MTALTIMVCTRNRAAPLARCLASIDAAIAAAPAVTAELIVIDNGSTDGSGETIARFKQSRPYPIHYGFEPVAGISRARNLGLRLFRAGDSDLLVMTDDDCVMARDYVRNVVEAFASGAPEVRGGRIDLGDPTDLPLTIKPVAEMQVYQPGRKLGGFVMGANLVLSRGVVEAVGDFDERFGAGGPLKAADDTDYLLRASGLGFPLIYDPSFAVSHFHGRKSRAEAVALMTGYSFGDGALYAKHLFRSTTAAKILKGAVVNAGRELFGKSGPDPILGERPFCFRLFHNARGAATYLMLRLFGRGGRQASAERKFTAEQSAMAPQHS